MNWGMSARPMDPKSMSSLLQGSHIINEERLSSWPLNVPTYSHNHQVDAEVYTDGIYLSPQSTIRSVDEGALTSYPDNCDILGINNDDFPTTCLSDTESMFPQFTTLAHAQHMSPQSTSDGSYPATVILNEDQRRIDLVNGDKSCMWYEERMPIDSLLDHSHRSTHAHTASDSPPVSSTFSTGICTTPTDAPHRNQRTSGEIPQGSKTSEEGPSVESPNAPLRSYWKPGAPPHRYRCTCGRDYAQPQGLMRHRREIHGASGCVCMYCGAFAWKRPYRFKEHIRRKHPGLDPEVALEKATCLKIQSSVTIKTKDIPQCSLPSAKGQSYPPSSPPAPMGVPPVFPPAVSPVGYDPQPGSAESTMETPKYEDTRDSSGSFGAYYAHITFPPSKQRAKAEKTDPDTFAGRVGPHDYRLRIGRTQSHC